MKNWDWQGKELKAKVLFSAKGLATQVLVSTGERLYLLDCGDGTSRDLALTNLSWAEQLVAILISHDHPDHTAGLFAVLTYLRLRGRKKELFILSPDKNLNYRLRYFRDSLFAGLPFEIEFKAVTENPQFCFSGLLVRPFATVHRERAEFFGTGGLLKAVGYVLQGRTGERIVYSGDTGWFRGIETIFKDADLALIEATFDFPKGPERHLTMKEAKELGKQAKNVIYIHR
ncbi:MAG: MBL fold metallo-hydrolase [bacterium]|jgi:ribonuclease BN (tRNA processing enzyme)|nr:MBL fold metallo-hydrolase [Caldisericota bacterium]